MLAARTKTIERTGTGRQFPPSLASLSATKFSLQIYMELTANEQKIWHQHSLSYIRVTIVYDKSYRVDRPLESLKG